MTDRPGRGSASQQTVLLTLGRLPKGLDIARSFHADGWRVIIAEPFGWHLCGLSRSVARSIVVPPPCDAQAAYLDALLDIVRREGVALVVPVSEETMHVASLSEHLPPGVGLFTSAPDAVLGLHDKLTFAQRLKTAGLAAPETALLGSERGAALAARRATVVKDRWGASGSNVTFHRPGETLPMRRHALVQERLEGEEVSTFSIVHAGTVTITVVYRSVIRDGTVATVFERIDRPDVEAYADDVARMSGHTGFLSLDLMITTAGPVAFECNPRANSGIHFLHTPDIARAVLDPDFRPRLAKQRRMQQAYPTLTLLWGAIGDWPRYRRIGKALLSARDVSWSLCDPLPFAFMTPATWPLLRQAIFEGRTLGEAAIRDIGWFGPAANETGPQPVKATGSSSTGMKPPD